LDDPVNRLLNAMEPGTVVPIHRHLHPYKSESLVVLRGELDVLLYNDEGQLTERITLNPSKGTYGMDISGDIWHSMEAKETGTVVYEVKTGPYVPIAEEDFLHN
jgi:cupin fold WbuC family metalloprotein